MECTKNNLKSAVWITGETCSIPNLLLQARAQKIIAIYTNVPGRYHWPSPCVLYGANAQERHLLRYPSKSKYSLVLCKITEASRKSQKHITWQSHLVQQTIHSTCKYTQLFLIKTWRNSTAYTQTTCLSQQHAGASSWELNTTMNYLCCHKTCKPHSKAGLTVLSLLQSHSRRWPSTG